MTLATKERRRDARFIPCIPPPFPFLSFIGITLAESVRLSQIAFSRGQNICQALDMNIISVENNIIIILIQAIVIVTVQVT